MQEQRLREFGILAAVRRFADFQRAFDQRRGLGVARLGLINFGQVVQRLANLGVILAQLLALDLQRRGETSLGLQQVSLVNQNQPQIVQSRADIGMRRAEHIPPNLQRLVGGAARGRALAVTMQLERFVMQSLGLCQFGELLGWQALQQFDAADLILHRARHPMVCAMHGLDMNQHRTPAATALFQVTLLITVGQPFKHIDVFEPKGANLGRFLYFSLTR